MSPDPGDLPRRLQPHYSRFRVGERLLLTGHSHQAWPDVAFAGQLAAIQDAADAVDEKWSLAFAQADRVRTGIGLLLDDPDAPIALAENTHDLLVRFLSCLDLRRRPRLVTTDGEFHSLRRQLARLAEEGVDLVRVPTEPVDTLAARLADNVSTSTAAVLVSAVLFETSRIVPELGGLADVCRQHEAELLVDAYHALGNMPFPVHELGLSTAWITGAGYKYLQLGEGNGFLRLPAQAEQMRPVVTGWFAEFDTLAADQRPDVVAYGTGAGRFAGATYDPTSHYRAARVFDFFREHGLTPARLRSLYLHQVRLLARLFDELDVPDEVITRDRNTPRAAFGGFLALRSPHADELRQRLRTRGVHVDSRGHYLRFGPAPYLTDTQLEAAMAALGDARHDPFRHQPDPAHRA